jgi:uncharacterized membrane protein
MNKIFALMILFVGLIGISSALTIESITVDSVSPGEEGIIRISVENDANEDVEDLSVRLSFLNPNIIPIGSSQEFLSRLDEDEEENFIFRFRVSNSLPAGTYSIGYNLEYNEGNDEIEQDGSIGILVSAEPEIEIVASNQNAIVGQQGTLDIRVINKGLADARFVSIKVDGDDMVFLSENSEYIGTIDSDDFETSSFDVIYNNRFSSATVIVSYKNFNNEDQEIIETVSLRAYSTQEAIEKGILNKSNATTYVGVIILLLVIWIVYRRIRRRNRKKE